MNDSNRLVDLLRELTGAFGPSGHEDAVRDLILSKIRDHADCRVDPLGNIIAVKRGSRRSAVNLMLDAHMDEVGMMITGVREDGLLNFSTVGGITTEVMLGKAVTFGSFDGVIGCVPVHLLSQEQKGTLPPADQLVIDIGASCAEQAKALVSPGDVCTFQSDFVRFGNGMIKAKAIDDRAGCAILIDLITGELPYDVTVTFSTREEVGLIGAKAAVFAVRPDVALVLESTTAADGIGSNEQNRVCAAGKGVVLSFMDRATLYHKPLFDAALRVAEQNGIPCQVKQAVAGGNNAGAIHAGGSGVPTAALSLPCRYLHGPCSVIHENDLLAARDLALALINELCSGSIRV